MTRESSVYVLALDDGTKDVAQLGKANTKNLIRLHTRDVAGTHRISSKEHVNPVFLSLASRSRNASVGTCTHTVRLSSIRIVLVLLIDDDVDERRVLQ